MSAPNPIPEAMLGLRAAEAAERLSTEGPNSIRREARTPAIRVFLRQFRGVMIWLLVAATVVSACLGETADAIAIAIILLLNALVGFVQEYRAEGAVLALRTLTAPRARVIRDGSPAVIPASDVVRGDLLLLEAGDVVAADARLVRSHALLVVESSLTGESTPVEKRLGESRADAPLAERFDRVFLGTQVAKGTATAEVVATGMSTELGKIAHLLAAPRESRTPLERKLDRVGRVLVALCLGVVTVIAAVQLLLGRPMFEVFFTAVSLAVAAIPEGLAAVVTVALALGVQRMASRHVLVRQLASVETLGSATVICTDKTGTLTTGEMSVREIRGVDQAALLRTATACCDADLDGNDGRGTGDPTEIAILRAAREAGIERGVIERENPRVSEIPFDPERKRMSVTRVDGSLAVKGAAEILLPLCTRGVEDADTNIAALAHRGLRVLGVARGRGTEERDLELLGVLGIADPPRREAIEAVRAARDAGVTTVMITGDHRATALAIARELDIVRTSADEDERVHARATPEDKLRIVRSWKERGAIVAMTGDGVNDAPALREADIGIAMGKSGTEVTREASDMVLADDNFASIVAAMREGRGIYENVRKTLVYLLAGNLGEIALVFGVTLLGFPTPLLPLHLLYINLVTDGLPALALVADPTPEDALDKPPRPTDEPILGRREWRRVVVMGLLEATFAISLFVYQARHHGLEAARAIVFTYVVFAEIFRALVARSRDRLFLETKPSTNLPLIAVVGGSFALQLALVASPFFARLFDLGRVGAKDIALALGLALTSCGLLDLAKLVTRSRPLASRSVVSAGELRPPREEPRTLRRRG